MRFFPGLNLSPCCLSPLFTKPLWTFGFSDYEVWVTAPPPAWSKQIKDRLNGVAPYRYPPATSSRFSPAPGAGGACSFLCSAVREHFVRGLRRVCGGGVGGGCVGGGGGGVPVIFDPSFMPNAAAAVPHTIGLRLPRIWGTPAHKAMYLTYRDGKGFSRPGNPPSAARSTRHMVLLYPRTPRVAESENLQAIGDRRSLSRPLPQR